MISPHTPPGTALVVVFVCTTDAEFFALVKPDYYVGLASLLVNGAMPSPFTLGQRVTLDKIEPSQCSVDGFAARIVGFPGAYPLKTFTVASLPSVLTDLLVDTDVPVSEDA